jgi:AcrR family transcriptional regulator
MGGSNGRVTPEVIIRDAALETWAKRGDRADVEEIAAAAGFSVEFVTERFATEELLREAVNEHVVAIAVEAFNDYEPEGSDDDAMDALGRRITNMILQHPNALLYVARSAIDGEPGAMGIFDAFMAIAIQQFETLRGEGRMDPDVDIEWASIHVVVFNLAILLFREAIENHLPESIMTPEGMERWHIADSELFRHGWLRQTAAR